MTAILGISAYYHDAAAALLVDGRIVAAAQEERFTRKKHDSEFPVNAIEYCLAEAGLDPGGLDYVGFYDKPLLKFERLLETYLSYAPRGFASFVQAMPIWLQQKLYLPRAMNKGLGHAFKKRYVFTEHHESHAASAFFPSPFEEAAIMTLDGVGEWATATLGHGRGNRIELTDELHFPHSLGLLYSAFTYYCGFTVNSGEYKLMGLAPYGQPTYVDLILDKLLDLKEDGSFRMDMSYFNYCQGLTMTSAKLHRLFGGPPRKPDAAITRRDMDVAASIQKVTEEIMLRCARHAHAKTGSKNLCLAGGVALNCVGNGRILREGPFENVWIQPAAGDAGGALGVALFIWHQLLDQPRQTQPGDSQRGSLLGPAFGDDQIRAFLDSVDAKYDYIGDSGALCDRIAGEIADGKVIAWFQDRMEFGPRALGARSILGDARDPRMQSVINLKVKFREGFRPFAPIVLAEHAHEYFDLDRRHESPYMLVVAPVRDDKRLEIPPELVDAEGIDKLKQMRSVVPAITHVDYSARIQTVDAARHGLLRAMMERFYEKTGCPVMVNTSFNLGWDPIVCSPADAYNTVMSSEIDMLCIGGFVVSKSAQRATVDAGDDGSGDEVLEGVLSSPCCGGTLVRRDETLACEACGHVFPITDNIPRLFWPQEAAPGGRDVTEAVKAYYEQAVSQQPGSADTVRSLIDRSRGVPHIRRLNETIPYNSSVLEIGCGTGRLANFLGISCRRVIGTDICLEGLRQAEAFRREQGLARVRFLQMNLFHPAVRPGQFDVVVCNGVLQHTVDPAGGFKRIAALVKPGGHIVIGLSNPYGRLLADVGRRLTGRPAPPRDSRHTFGEVLGWFHDAGVEFVQGVPAMRPQDNGAEGVSLFEPQRRGTPLERFLVQAAQLFGAGRRQRGAFFMIGRKPGEAPARGDAPGADRSASAGKSDRRPMSRSAGA